MRPEGGLDLVDGCESFFTLVSKPPRGNQAKRKEGGGHSSIKMIPNRIIRYFITYIRSFSLLECAGGRGNRKKGSLSEPPS